MAVDPKKDVIYIDTEDDITAIIGKVKAASARIVALVPPKRIGVLQSVVNLKLLQKAATTANKQIVLISADPSLVLLAGDVRMPIAKNLQTKPEVPELETPTDEEENIIRGDELTVGDVVPETKEPKSTADTISDAVDLDALEKQEDAKEDKSKKGKAKKPIRIPDFNRFRTRLFIGLAVLLVLIPFLYWANVIAPQVHVLIDAKTNPVNISRNLTLDPGVAQSNVGSLTFKPVSQQLKKTQTVNFTATGQQQVGNQATGSITVTNSTDSNTDDLPSGTQFLSADGHKFVSTAAATVPGATVNKGQVQAGSATVSVQAAAIGPDYNVGAQSYTVEGFSNLSAQGAAMSGGTSQTVTVVSQDDVTKAAAQIAKVDTNTVSSQLVKQFPSNQLAIVESLTSTSDAPVSTPAVGAQAQQAKLSVTVTYTMLGLDRGDVSQLLTSALNTTINGKSDEQILDNGGNGIQFRLFQSSGSTSTVELATTGYTGAKVDIASLTKEFEGLRTGQIAQIVNQLPGVNNVTINMSPFWVSSAPHDPKKIHVEFSISGNGNH